VRTLLSSLSLGEYKIPIEKQDRRHERYDIKTL
jgi:hypothetical protein